VTSKPITLAPATVDPRILRVRGIQVLVDADLAEIYGVSTKALNQAVKRNAERFPEDFRFQLTAAEREEVVTNCDHLTRLKFSPVLPWAFTEHGSIMAASVLNSQRAVEMSVFVVRAFVRLRDLARTHAELARHLDALERRVTVHDADLKGVFVALRRLIEPPSKPRRQIGFGRKSEP
jgi:ORF6N domain